MDFCVCFFLLASPHPLERKLIFAKNIHTHHLGFYTVRYWQEYRFHCALSSISPSLRPYLFSQVFFCLPLLPALCVEHQEAKRCKVTSCMAIYYFSYV